MNDLRKHINDFDKRFLISPTFKKKRPHQSKATYTYQRQTLSHRRHTE